MLFSKFSDKDINILPLTCLKKEEIYTLFMLKHADTGAYEEEQYLGLSLREWLSIHTIFNVKCIEYEEQASYWATQVRSPVFNNYGRNIQNVIVTFEECKHKTIIKLDKYAYGLCNRWFVLNNIS